jgi:hypothetical protein
MRIVHVISGAVTGNILAGGFIGWGVDAALVRNGNWSPRPSPFRFAQ